MFRNYFFINIILILIVSFLGLRFYKAIIYKKDNPLNITVKKAEPDKIKAAGEDKGIDKESLKVITEKDIFRSSRTASSSDANSTEMPPKNPPTLFGTVIVGAEKTALLKEEAGKAAKMYRVNESISGYLIVDIQDDKVLLEAGGQTIEVKLRGKRGANMSQPTPGAPVQKMQEGAGVARRRVRPNPQRPARNETNIKAPAPTPVPAPVSPAPVPVPAPEPVPNPEPPEGVPELPEEIQQQ
ncbi:MAG: hypothetical protein HZC48_11430 [Nitrospirae bacterium]|nr:hypothetical protein [Nitrospirota bacterium]